MQPSDPAPAPYPRGAPLRRYVGASPQRGTRALRPGEAHYWRRRIRVLVRDTLLAVVGTVAVTYALTSWIDLLAPDHVAALGGAGGTSLAALGLLGVGQALVALVRPSWARLAVGAFALLVITVTALAPASALASPGLLRSAWVAVVLAGNGTLALFAWRRARLLARIPRLHEDLRRGVVETYVDDDTGARLDVLASSGVVIVPVGGVPQRGAWDLVQVAEVASAQPHAFRTELPRELVAVQGAAATPRFRLQRRSLSPHEHAELHDHIQRLRRAARPALAAVAAAAAVLAVRCIVDPDWHNLTDAVAVGWYVLAIIAAVGFARRTAAARRLSCDLALRWVVTVDDAGEHDDAEAAARLELLPISHLAWTENQVPAQWRLHRT